MSLNLSLSNYSAGMPVITETVLSIKDTCYGLAGYQALLLCIALIGINFLIAFFWKNLSPLRFQLRIKEKFFYLDVLKLLPIINFILAGILFVYIYNIF